MTRLGSVFLPLERNGLDPFRYYGLFPFHYYGLLSFRLCGLFFRHYCLDSFLHCWLSPFPRCGLDHLFVIAGFFLSVIAGLTRNPLLALVMKFPCRAGMDYIPIIIGTHPVSIICKSNHFCLYSLVRDCVFNVIKFLIKMQLFWQTE